MRPVHFVRIPLFKELTWKWREIHIFIKTIVNQNEQ